jgi:transposase
VLSYSNWEWGVICHSESLLALRRGVQATLQQLGHVPAEHWTDHSTAATHEVEADENGRRQFNLRYLDFMRHFGITPRTTQVKEPHENGDVESANGAFKRRAHQQLLLRGHLRAITVIDGMAIRIDDGGVWSEGAAPLRDRSGRSWFGP